MKVYFVVYKSIFTGQEDYRGFFGKKEAEKYLASKHIEQEAKMIEKDC